jgi:hypothetical protein
VLLLLEAGRSAKSWHCCCARPPRWLRCLPLPRAAAQERVLTLLPRPRRHAAQRYYGTAVGKGRQAAKNEIEKLKLGEMSCRQAVMEAARILHKVGQLSSCCRGAGSDPFCCPLPLPACLHLTEPPRLVPPSRGGESLADLPCASRPAPAPQIHEEDGKQFELELTWLCEESSWQHGRVPKELQAEAERSAKAALEDSDMDDD